MNFDITAVRRVAGRVKHRTTARSALAGLAFLALSTTALGADLDTRYRTAISPRTSPSPVPEVQVDYPDVQRQRALDDRAVVQLYGELMRSSACYKPNAASEARYRCDVPDNADR